MFNGFLFKVEKNTTAASIGHYFVKSNGDEVEKEFVKIDESIKDLKNDFVFFVEINLIDKKNSNGIYDVTINKKIKLNKGIEYAVDSGELFMLLNQILKAINNENGEEK